MMIAFALAFRINIKCYLVYKISGVLVPTAKKPYQTTLSSSAHSLVSQAKLIQCTRIYLYLQ